MPLGSARTTRRRLFPVVIAAAALILGTTLPAKPETTGILWTAAGSTGIPDEADLAKIEFDNPVAMISPAIAKAEVVLRYNVLAVSGTPPPPDTQIRAINLRVGYRDNGGNAKVIARLRELVLGTGGEDELLAFDSDRGSAASAFQVGTAFGECTRGTRSRFDFVAKVYYIQVSLIKQDASANPAIASLQLFRGDCR
jgi:hypothetical protein